MTKIIFVAGVHGVGKGTICHKIESQFGLHNFTASSLIKSVKNSAVDNDKVVVDAGKNQDYLLMAIEQLNVDSEYILIDGHFCLQGSSGIFDVPIETFQGMNLVATLLLTDDVSAIYQRLYSRDGKSLDESTIEELQNREQDRANSVTSSLKIPLYKGSIYNYNSIENWLTGLIHA